MLTVVIFWMVIPNDVSTSSGRAIAVLVRLLSSVHGCESRGDVDSGGSVSELGTGHLRSASSVTMRFPGAPTEYVAGILGQVELPQVLIQSTPTSSGSVNASGTGECPPGSEKSA